MTQRNPKHAKPALVALLVSMALLLAAPPGLAQPLVEQEGVIEVGTIDPYTESESASGGTTTGTGSSSGSTDASRCLINAFGSCLLQLDEHNEFDDTDQGQTFWYYYDHHNEAMSGYYVDLMGGMVFARAASGSVEDDSGSGSQGAFTDYHRTLYENNLGYSEEHEDETLQQWDHAEEDASSVQRLTAEAGVDAPVAEGGVEVEREANGVGTHERDGAQSGSNRTSDEYFGIPLYAADDSQSSFVNERSREFWNQTRAGGNVYLVNPTDGSRLEIVGLRMTKGDRAGDGSYDAGNGSSESTSVFGFKAYEHSEDSAGSNEYAFFEQWLRLDVDLVGGTVSGDVAYERGEASGESSEDEGTQTNILGIPLYGEDHGTDEEFESEWREVSFTLDAVQGAGVVELGAWDDSSRSHEAWEDTYEIVGIGVGAEGERESSFHSDGLSLGLDVGGGALWLGLTYENRSESESEYTDIVLEGSPLAGISHDEESAARGVYVGAGSSLVPVSAGAHHENSSSHQDDSLRLGGEDFAGLTQDDEHTEWGGDADAAGLVVFSLLYSNGRSDDALHLAGVPLGLRDHYQEFEAGASGEARDPTGGHLFSYSFEHEEKSHDYDAYVDDSTLGGARHNTTSDRVNVIVLDGAAQAHFDREFSNTQVIAGEDTEIAEVGLQQVDAGVEHEAVDAGPAHVDEGSAGASVVFAYIEAADTIALLVGAATWCVDPGVQVPYDAVLGPLPAEARALGGTVLAVVGLATCFGAPVIAPLFLASPCIVVPLALGTVFVTSGVVASLLPAGGDLVNAAVGTAEPAVWGAYDELVGCIWLTIPDAARNPQPVLWALDPANDAADEALAQAWPVYDGARVTAWSVLDAAFDEDARVPVPEGLAAPV